MERQLIGRGVLAGALAGLLAFVFARIFAEPVIVKSIAYEDAVGAAQAALDRAAGIAVEADGPDLVSRGIQMNVGLGAGLILFGAAMGALVAVAYVIAVGRIKVRPFQLALLVPVFFFIGFYVVPFAKYPANPPAVSDDETIRSRGASWLIIVFLASLFLFLAVYAGQRLHRRLALYPTVLVMGVAYVAVMAVVMFLMPGFDETPGPMRDPSGAIVLDGFPADLLASFRVYSFAAQVILWGTIALVFAPLAKQVLEPAPRAVPAAATA
ncbi:MAG: CbtA family protein [Nocardioides sp.]|uniref:CbtA family protein n=1 Tax=Nocardioides sp. TaxID=35761 RepID=UPI0039E49856